MPLLTLYLLTTLVKLGAALQLLSLISFALLMSIHLTATIISYCESEPQNLIPHFYKMLSGIVLMALLSITIPSKDEAVLIAGAYITTNTKGIDKLPANVVGAANKFLEDIAKETDKE